MPVLTETVREIALSQPSAVRVFEQFGIDYCCGGKKPLAEACAEQKLEPGLVLAALEAAQATPMQERTEWNSLAELCAEIVATHHVYVRRELPRLQEMAAKVLSRHGSNHAELQSIRNVVAELAEELTQHLVKEEMVLFPYIAQLEQAQATGGSRPHSCFGDISNPIAMMIYEHEGAGEKLRAIRRLSNNLLPPADACTTYHAFYAALGEFEQDLHRHIHKENNILFPRAITMESSAAA